MPKLIPDWCQHGCPPPPDHQCDTEIILIGEAPGPKEDEFGQPFIGPTWAELRKWWDAVGIPFKRRDFYITNVYPYWPGKGRPIVSIPSEQIRFWTERLWERLSRLSGPKLLIPCGNLALRAICGEYRAIGDWHSSVITIPVGKRLVKCIPTIHPAATFRQPILAKFCVADWIRIYKESAFSEVRTPRHTTIVEPTNDEFSRFVHGAEHAGYIVSDGIATPPVLAVDIELDRKTKELLCVGYSYEESSAMILPMSPRALATRSTLERMWNYARVLNSNGLSKVLQNGQFDAFHLHRNKLSLNRYDWDLMEMDHAFDPNDGGDISGSGETYDDDVRISMRSLAALASLHWQHPFWKHQGKMDAAGFRWDLLYEYNGIDCRATRAIFIPLFVKLAKDGRLGKDNSVRYSLDGALGTGANN